ncbi:MULTISPECIES: hypothetical protein [Streptomyces]|uniref:hypothetical protein n=1 Tax=Streptomyces TaxID=1883 RepID=UPI000B9EEC3A|nr:hypothetical protein [Streptomyces kasugaensis]
MRSSVTAVIGTLLGSITTYGRQQRTARTRRTEVRTTTRQYEDTRQQLTTAVTDFIDAVGDHRMAACHCEGLRLLDGGGGPAWRDAKARSRTTCAAITAPLTTVTVLAPALAGVAAEAATATYALPGAPNTEALDTLREDAMAAWLRFIAAAEDAGHFDA